MQTTNPLAILRKWWQQQATSSAELELLTLEERILYSATPVPDPTLGVDVADTTAINWDDPALLESLQTALHPLAICENAAGIDCLSETDPSQAVAPDFAAQSTDVQPEIHAPIASHELLFVDQSIEQVDALIAELIENADESRTFDIVYLDHRVNGFEQIEQAFANDIQYDALHFISHGDDGMIRLGGSWLDLQTVEAQHSQIEHWSDSLTADADIFFYGCELSSTAEGELLLERLHELTTADIAASDDNTGSSLRGADWDLESHISSDNSQYLESLVAENWTGSLATYIVSNTNDTGTGSLHQAILNANANFGADTIAFNIGSGVQTITLSTALPKITGQVTIDGWTQGGWSSAPLIEIDGNGISSSGLTFDANSDNSVIRGLIIRDFAGNGITLESGVDNVVIQGNYIGRLNSSGGDAGAGEANTGVGIYSNGGNAIIGGISSAQRNVISGNGAGIMLDGSSASNNLIWGNYIGLNATGTSGIGNTGSGILIQSGSGSNTIGTNLDGSNDALEGNVISANTNVGVQLWGAGSNNTIRGNFIGTNAAGTSALGNGTIGIQLGNATANTTIGGISSHAANVITANVNAGIELIGAGTTNNTIQGNFVGTNSLGTTGLGNQAGIYIANSASGNTIGGTANGAGNTFSNNTNDGIATDSSAVNNPFLRNLTYGNGGEGIDLSINGVTANDVGDGDIGGNNLQNFPVLTSAISTGTAIHIAGSLNSAASSYYRVEFYANSSADASGYGEGQTYLGFVNVSTNSSGSALIDTQISAVIAEGVAITATATKSNALYTTFTDTSEYSQNQSARGPVENTLPGAQSTPEDTTLVFSTANGNAIRVDDGTASTSELLQVSLSVPSGNLTLASTVGLTFVGGANGSSGMVLWGTEADINTALDGLSFLSTSDFNGTVNLAIATTIDHSLQGFYEFENGGTPGLDTSVGTLQNGSLLGNAAIMVDGTRGSVVTLDGSGDAISINSIFSSPQTITIGGWVNLSALSTGRAEFISLDDRVHLALDDVFGVKGSVQITSGGWTDLHSNYFVAGTGWRHVMYVFDGINDEHRLYIDGVEVASEANTNIIDWASATTTYIGRHPVTTPGWDMDGEVDDVRIFTRALNDAEVALLAAETDRTMGSITINVTALNDSPVITSNGGGDSTIIFIKENSTAVTTVSATDPEVPTQTLTYSVAGGVDAAFFQIDSGTGALSFIADPDYESFADHDGNNVYEVVVQVSDGGGGSDTQNIEVAVTDLSNILTVTTEADNNDSGISSGNALHTIEWLNDNLGADSAISLREAIIAANNTSNGGAPDEIRFNISGGGVRTISVGSALPAISDSVWLNGATQSGYSNSPLIRLDGFLAIGTVDGLTLNGSSGTSTIDAIMVTRFTGSGLVIATTNNVIRGNLIGIDAAGADLGNGADGIVINGNSNTIGGTNGSDRNVISGNNLAGIRLQSAGNSVLGNIIGLDATGVFSVANNDAGIVVDGANNTIGSALVGGRNVIAGNLQEGLLLTANADGSAVRGNYIGTDLTGLIDLGNAGSGILFQSGAEGITIGGNAIGMRNVISGNNGEGIALFGGISNSISGNYIGLGVDGLTPLGNSFDGIHVAAGANSNIIGGSTDAERNVISANGTRGIQIEGSTTFLNVVLRNYVGTDSSGNLDRGNALSGILIGNGATQNIIGQAVAGDGNLVSGNNGPAGIEITSDSNYILGNIIGLNGAGNAALANAGIGLYISSARDNQIGGSISAARNVISGNSSDGIQIVGQISAGNTIQGNYIGTNTLGTTAIGNGGNGIFLNSAGQNSVGGSVAALGNTIAGNAANGILISGYGAGADSVAWWSANGNAIDLVNGNDGTLFGNTSYAAGLNGQAYDFDGSMDYIQVADAANLRPTNLTVETWVYADTLTPGFHVAVSKGNTGSGPLPSSRNSYLLGFYDSQAIFETTHADGTATVLLSPASLATGVWHHLVGSFDGATVRLYVDGTEVTSQAVASPLVYESGVPLLLGTDYNDGVIASAWLDGRLDETAVYSEALSATDIRRLYAASAGAKLGSTIQANRIGLAADGITAAGNSQHGVALSNTLNQLIGGTSPAEQNAIAFNGYDGIAISGATSQYNAILGNEIYSNVGIGIDLSDNGPTLNDANDIDAGPNLLQNFPTLSTVVTQGTSTTVTGSLNSTANASFQIDYFSSPSGDTTGYGEGVNYLGSAMVTTDGSGNASLNTVLAGVTLAEGTTVTATATPSFGFNAFGGTSEFSAGVLSSRENSAITIVGGVNAIGAETRTNTYTANWQYGPDVNAKNIAVDALGNYVIIWDSLGQDGLGWGIYGQLFNAAGVAVGSEFLINQTTTGNEQFGAVAMAANGTFVVTWQSDQLSQQDIYARRFSAAGAALGNEFLVNSATTGIQQQPSIGMDTAGNFVIAWETHASGDYDISAQRYDSNGNPLGGEFTVNTLATQTQSLASVAMNASGEFVVVWTSSTGDGSGDAVYGQLYANDGTAVSGEILINQTTASNQRRAEVAIDSQGRFTAVWESNQNGNYDVYFRRFDESGVAITGEMLAHAGNGNYQGNAGVTHDANGNLLVVWSSDGQDGSGYGVYGRRFTHTGIALENEFLVNATTVNAQDFSNAIFLPNGDFVIEYEGTGAGDTSGVFHRRFSTQLQTTEAGGSSQLIVVLNQLPTADVTLSFSSSNLLEGTVSPASLNFNAGDWSTPKTVTITGVDDVILDGDVNYSVSTPAVTSLDTVYGGLDPEDFVVVNLDNEVATLSISGTIFEDVNGNAAILDDGSARSGVTVLLYSDNGDGTPGVGDSLVNSVTTNGSGQYTFTGLGSGTYWVVVDSLTLTPTAGLNGGFTGGDLWAEQTYASAGGVAWNGTYSFTTVSGAFLGGMNRTSVSDNIAAGLASAEHIHRVIVTSVNITGIESGFSFNVITRTGDGDDDGTANRTVQGSMRQFIQNANAIVGLNASQFQLATSDANYSPFSNSWRFQPTSSLPSITDQIRLDGTTQSGYSGTPVIELNGSSGASEGIYLTSGSDGSTIHRLVINQFSGRGILMDGGAGNHVITGNYIGTDVTGLLNRGNGAWGIDLIGAGLGITIGSANPIERNIIGGNTGFGGIAVNGTSGVTIIGNFIGVGVDGTTVIANGDGIFTINGFSGVKIGDTTPGSGNTIAYNNGTGIYMGTGTASILGNSIHDNGALGIDLGTGGITANDVQDTDLGPNGLQNFPLLATILSSGGMTRITGSLPSSPSSDYRIEFFASPAGQGDPSGNGEGARYLGATNVSTDLSGNATFSIDLATTVNAGDLVTATATLIALPGQYGGTSEFSPYVAASSGILVVHRLPIAITSEAGQTDTFSVVLTAAPTDDVIVNLSSSDLTEGTVSASSLTFTTANWNIPQIVTITGQSDLLGDGDVAYTISLAPAISTDALFSGLDPIDVSVINLGQGNTSPVNSVPGLQTVAEDTALVFAAVNGNAISLSDVDVGLNDLEVTLIATNGSLTLSSWTGLTFTVGDGTADTTMTFRGSLIDLNNALEGMSFLPTGNYDGSAAISLTTNDLGNTGSGGPLTDVDVISINVFNTADAPQIILPSATPTTNEDASVVLTNANNTALQVHDVDAGEILQLSITLVHGQWSLSTVSGLTFIVGTGVADRNVTFQGTEADINAALDGATYQPDADYNGLETISLNLSDAASLTDLETQTLTIAPVNDAPIAAADAYSTYAGSSLTITSPTVLVNDYDLDGDALSVTWLQLPANGSFVGFADGQFVFTPNGGFIGTDSFTYRLNDGTTQSAPVTVTVNVLPFSGGGDGGSGEVDQGDSGGESEGDSSGDGDSSENDSQEDGSEGDSESGNGAGSDGNSQNELDRRTNLPLAVNLELDVAHDSNLRRGAVITPWEITPQQHSVPEEVSGSKRKSDHPLRFDRAATVEARQLVDWANATEEQILENLLSNLRQEIRGETEMRDLVASTATAATAALSAGYALWALKSGHLLASLLASMPAWKHIDPLPVVNDADLEREDEESLADIAHNAKQRS